MLEDPFSEKNSSFYRPCRVCSVQFYFNGSVCSGRQLDKWQDRLKWEYNELAGKNGM